MTDISLTRTTGAPSWGRAHRGVEHVAAPTVLGDVPVAVAAAQTRGFSALGVGLRRSYGDSGLNLGGGVVDMTRLDHFISFDPAAGVLRGEAGLSLSTILRHVTPKGWFLPTTPGSRFVTLGGAVANDVHGKNHHEAGAFGASVRAIGLWRSDRGHVELRPDKDRELFETTIGGLGLTGLITWVEIQLAPIASTWLDQETLTFGGLGEFFDIAKDSEGRFEHTAAWIDCASKGTQLGRGAFSRANWRSDGRLDPHSERLSSVPFDAPNFALNPLSVRAFNEVVFRRYQLAPRLAEAHYAGAFYPLDAVGRWNRIYGPRGFYQYQCVIPDEHGRDAVDALMKRISRSGQGSFLAVLKTFGARPSPGRLSFPRQGVTLALDFPNVGARLASLMGDLDAIVSEARGRLYPAKDGRMPPAMFKAGYPQWPSVEAARDPAVSSSFWRRILND